MLCSRSEGTGSFIVNALVSHSGIVQRGCVGYAVRVQQSDNCHGPIAEQTPVGGQPDGHMRFTLVSSGPMDIAFR